MTDATELDEIARLQAALDEAREQRDEALRTCCACCGVARAQRDEAREQADSFAEQLLAERHDHERTRAAKQALSERAANDLLAAESALATMRAGVEALRDEFEHNGLISSAIAAATLLASCAPATANEQGATETVTEYVVGFAIDDHQRVAMIRKNRPEWQAGRLNGIGGHVEPGEAPEDAMRREFREETGVGVNAWTPLVVMDFPRARIHFFRARVGSKVLDLLSTTTDEEVVVLPLMTLAMAPAHLIPNLTWLLPLAAYTADEYEPIYVRAAMAEAISAAEVTSSGGAQAAAPHWSKVVLGHDRVLNLTEGEHGVLSDAVHEPEEDASLACACEPVYAAVERIFAARTTAVLKVADDLAAYDCTVRPTPQGINSPRDYEAGLHRAALMIRAALAAATATATTDETQKE